MNHRHTDWAFVGSEQLPLRGSTIAPAGSARAVALIIHGFTGNKDRNIIPAVAVGLADRGFLTHRVTLSHAGVGDDGDSITRLDEFQRDSVNFCIHDIRTVVSAIAEGELAGADLPLVLIGHSRGGAQVLGAAGRAYREDWTHQPEAVVSLAGVRTYAPLEETERYQLHKQGHLRRQVARAAGGEVRLGRSWFEHDLDNPGRDIFGEDVASIRCPVLLVHGAEDLSVPIDHMKHLAQRLARPGGPVVRQCIIANADHNFNALGVGVHRENLLSPGAAQVCDEIAQFVNAQVA